MKTLKLLTLGMIIFISNEMFSQVSVSVNIGSPPLWGPVGYTEARYYYLPDIEAYYDVQSSMFIYYGNGGWIRRNHLPGRHSGYDLYGGYKVVMTDYYGETPYVNFVEYKTKYAKGYGGNGQKTIGNRPGNKNSKSPKEYDNFQPNDGGQGTNNGFRHSNNGNGGNGNQQHGNGEHGKGK